MKKTKQGNEENDGTDVTKKANDEDGADRLFTRLYVTLVIIIIACPILLLKVVQATNHSRVLHLTLIEANNKKNATTAGRTECNGSR